MPRLPAQFLRLWHVLSLDAPTVAALWCWALARAVHIHLPVAAPLMLALGTWLLYVADRLLDGLLAPHPSRLRERHLFHLRHRPAFVAASVCGVIALALLVVWCMPGFVLRAYIVLGICALLYLLLVHIPRLRTPAGFIPFARVIPKELAVGLIFAAATVIPTWERLRRTAPADAAPLLLLLPLFAALCTLNCIAIEIWENAADPAAGGGGGERRGDLDAAGPASLHPITRVLGRHLTLTALLLTAAAGIGAAFLRMRLRNGPAAAVALALALSALLFALLDRRPRILSPGALRIAADAVLLTPLLLLPVLR
ncbi:MAG: hypothetical protein ACR2JE_16950 [Acidobacteriaceae bacterium]